MRLKQRRVRTEVSVNEQGFNSWAHRLGDSEYLVRGGAGVPSELLQRRQLFAAAHRYCRTSIPQRSERTQDLIPAPISDWQVRQ